MNDEREFIERSLADLDRERDAGDLSAEDHAELTERYRRKLAALDATPSRSGPDRARERASDWDQNEGGGRRWGRSLVAGALVVAIGVGGGLAVARSSGSREPGETITGSAPSTSSAQLAKAARLFAEGEAVEAFKIYEAVLAENPDDVEALTYEGWQWRNVGNQVGSDEFIERGIRLIERATDVDPTYSQAWFFRGVIYYRDEDKPTQAVDALKLALANDPIPEVSAAARELLAEIDTAS